MLAPGKRDVFVDEEGPRAEFFGHVCGRAANVGNVVGNLYDVEFDGEPSAGNS
jgi:hypothetical protein